MQSRLRLAKAREKYVLKQLIDSERDKHEWRLANEETAMGNPSALSMAESKIARLEEMLEHYNALDVGSDFGRQLASARSDAEHLKRQLEAANDLHESRAQTVARAHEQEKEELMQELALAQERIHASFGESRSKAHQLEVFQGEHESNQQRLSTELMEAEQQLRQLGEENRQLRQDNAALHERRLMQSSMDDQRAQETWSQHEGASIALARAEAKVQLLQDQLNQRLDKERLDTARIQQLEDRLTTRAGMDLEVLRSGGGDAYLLQENDRLEKENKQLRQKAGLMSRYAGDEELAIEMLEEENRQLAEENALLKSKIIDAIEFHDSDHMGPYGKNILDLFKSDGRVMVQALLDLQAKLRNRDVRIGNLQRALQLLLDQDDPLNASDRAKLNADLKRQLGGGSSQRIAEPTPRSVYPATLLDQYPKGPDGRWLVLDAEGNVVTSTGERRSFGADPSGRPLGPSGRPLPCDARGRLHPVSADGRRLHFGNDGRPISPSGRPIREDEPVFADHLFASYSYPPFPIDASGRAMRIDHEMHLLDANGDRVPIGADGRAAGPDGYPMPTDTSGRVHPVWPNGSPVSIGPDRRPQGPIHQLCANPNPVQATGDDLPRFEWGPSLSRPDKLKRLNELLDPDLREGATIYDVPRTVADRDDTIRKLEQFLHAAGKMDGSSIGGPSTAKLKMQVAELKDIVDRQNNDIRRKDLELAGAKKGGRPASESFSDAQAAFNQRAADLQQDWALRLSDLQRQLEIKDQELARYKGVLKENVNGALEGDPRLAGASRMLQHELELKDDRIAQLEAEYSSILPIRNELETLRAQLEAADAAGAQWQTLQHDLEALRTEVHTAKDETSDSGRPESGSIVIDGARDPRTAREFDAAVNPVHLAIQVLRELKARLRAAEDAVGILKQRMSSARMSHAENESELEGLRAMVDNGNRDLSDLMKENTHLRESLEHAQAATHRMRDRQREMQSNLDMARAKSAQVNQLAAQLMGSLQGKDHVLAKQLFEKQAETDQLWQSMAQQRDASRTDMKDVGKPAGQSPLELLRAWANYLESTILLSDEEVSHACIACVRMNGHNGPAYHAILRSSRLPDVVHTCVSSRAAALHRRTARASARRPASCCG